jgi:hypothetical protein
MADLNPNSLLSRSETAEALTAEGFPVAKSTLDTKAVRGGGPPFRRFGRVVLYEWGDSLAWAKSQLGPKIRSTSEADIPRFGQRAEGNTAAQ